MEKCSNNHTPIHWDWEDAMTLKCPLCTERREIVTEEVDDYELENLRAVADELGNNVNSLEHIIDEKDENIAEKDEEINELKATISDLKVRISESVLGEMDRLKEKMEKLREEKNTIIIEKNHKLRNQENDLKVLENKVIPPHIPFEQYQKYLDERRER